jgi:hypothetical protein
MLRWTRYRSVVLLVVLPAASGCGQSASSAHQDAGAGAGGSAGAGTGGMGAGGSGAGRSGAGGSSAGTGGAGGSSRGGTGGAGASSTGGAGANTTGGAGSGGTGAAGGAAGSGDYYVRAVVGGEPLVAEMAVSTYWFEGLQQGYVVVEGRSADHQWYIVTRENTVTNGCSYITLEEIPRNFSTVLSTVYDGGSCSLTVTTEAPNPGDVLEGTFTAVLKIANGTEGVNAIEGSFRAPRLAEMPR